MQKFAATYCNKLCGSIERIYILQNTQSAVNGLGKNVYFLHKLVNQLFGFKNNKVQNSRNSLFGRKIRILSHPQPDFMLFRAKWKAPSVVEICQHTACGSARRYHYRQRASPSASLCSLLGFWFVCKGLWKSELRRRALVGHFRVYLDKITCKSNKWRDFSFVPSCVM